MLSISAFALLAAAQSAPEEKPVAPPPIIRTVPTAPPIMIPSPPPPPPPPPPRTIEPARARANLASYVSVDDYPAEALFNEEEGTVAFRLFVGPNARVTDCLVTSSSGSPSLDETSCRIMRTRARFTPARDSNGNPTDDRVSSRIRWQFADEEPPAPAEPAAGAPEPVADSVVDLFPARRTRPTVPLALLARDEVLEAQSAGRSGTTHFELAVNADGRVGECVVRVSSGLPELDASACRIAGTARFTPARDASGNAAADRHRGHINWASPAQLPSPPLILITPTAPPPKQRPDQGND